MSHRDTQVAWDIDSEEPVYIGDRREWEMTGRDNVGPEGRPFWRPRVKGAKKADRGRNHYCCSHRHVPIRVNQGARNKWSFSDSDSSNLMTHSLRITGSMNPISFMISPRSRRGELGGVPPRKSYSNHLLAQKA